MSNQERISQRAYQLWEQACREIEGEGGSPLTESDLASGGLGPAADALREVAGSPVKDADMSLDAENPDMEQHATNTSEKIESSI
jgi:hypothetical protein